MLPRRTPLATRAGHAHHPPSHRTWQRRQKKNALHAPYYSPPHPEKARRHASDGPRLVREHFVKSPRLHRAAAGLFQEVPVTNRLQGDSDAPFFFSTTSAAQKIRSTPSTATGIGSGHAIRRILVNNPSRTKAILHNFLKHHASNRAHRIEVCAPHPRPAPPPETLPVY